MCVVDEEGNIAGDNSTTTFNKVLHALAWVDTSSQTTFEFDSTCEDKYLFLWIKNAATPTTDYTAAQIQEAFSCIVVE